MILLIPTKPKFYYHPKNLKKIYRARQKFIESKTGNDILENYCAILQTDTKKLKQNLLNKLEQLIKDCSNCQM